MEEQLDFDEHVMIFGMPYASGVKSYPYLGIQFMIGRIIIVLMIASRIWLDSNVLNDMSRLRTGCQLPKS